MNYPKTMEFLQACIDRPRRSNEWVYEFVGKKRVLSAYMRTGVRPFVLPDKRRECGYVLELSNLQVDDTGKGYFTAWLDAVLTKANERFNFVFVENVLTPRFALFFIKRGWNLYDSKSLVPSYFKPLANREGVESVEDDGLSKACSRLFESA